MSEAQVQRSENVEDLASEFTRRLRIARAAELARVGRLLKAEALLCPTGTSPNQCDELDLLARILVKQKRFADAHRHWRKAFEKAKDKERFQRCIVVLQDYVERYTRRLRLLWTAGFGVWVVLLVVILAYFIKRCWP